MDDQVVDCGLLTNQIHLLTSLHQNNIFWNITKKVLLDLIEYELTKSGVKRVLLFYVPAKPFWLTNTNYECISVIINVLYRQFYKIDKSICQQE